MKKIFAVIIIALILPVVANAEVLLRDNFEYVVDRNVSNDAIKFTTAGPWAYVKATNSGQSGARGYLYTVSTIPGYAGSFPGQSSSRVMAVEMMGSGGQTDAYVGINSFPANVWFQFWIYPQNYGSQLSRFGTGKFLYPCSAGQPATCSPGDLDWLLTYDQHLHDLGNDAGAGNFFFINEAPDNSLAYTGNYGLWRNNLIGANIAPLSQAIIYSNRWTLVKMNMNMMAGSWEMWIKSVSGSFVKVASYINGTGGTRWTPLHQHNYTWLKLFTTINEDCWFYIDDFVMATTEADLPIYGGQGDSSLIPPQNVRIAQ